MACAVLGQGGCCEGLCPYQLLFVCRQVSSAGTHTHVLVRGPFCIANGWRMWGTERRLAERW